MNQMNEKDSACTCASSMGMMCPVHGGKKCLRKALLCVAVLLSLFLLVKTIAEIKTIGTIGEGIAPQNTITVSGEGDAFVVPDIATVTYDVTSEAANVPDAQKAVTTQANDILAYLKSVGIDDKDIKTVNYNIYPRYEYNQKGMICPANANCYQPSGTQTLAGYDVTDSVQVTIRKTDDAGKILAGLGAKKVTNLSGLNFTVEHPDAVQADARNKAITDAKGKADILAKQLGVHLSRIVSFSENGSSPIYYGKAMAMDSAAMAPAPVAPQIPVGQNKITSNVSITYEIN